MIEVFYDNELRLKITVRLGGWGCGLDVGLEL